MPGEALNNVWKTWVLRVLFLRVVKFKACPVCCIGLELWVTVTCDYQELFSVVLDMRPPTVDGADWVELTLTPG